jgi:hypothetical protein
MRHINTNLLPKMYPTFIKWPFGIKTIFEDQQEHIIEKIMAQAKTCLSKPDMRQGVLYAPPGSGKTTMFIVDLFWRVAKLAKDSGKKNQLMVITTPDGGVTEDILNQLQAYYDDNDAFDLISDAGLNWTGLFNKPIDGGKKVMGRGLEIVVCNNQMLLQEEQHEHLKKFEITMLVSDEAHRGLGCTDTDNYVTDIGHNNTKYTASWYWAMRDLKYCIWIGMTGTMTQSHKEDKENFYLISDKMEKSDWRLPFFTPDLVVYDDGYWSDIVDDNIKETFLNISTRNAIGKYLKDKIDFSKLSPENKLIETKVTAIIKCGATNSKNIPTPHEVRLRWNRLCREYVGKTFEYDGVELEYDIGRMAIMTSDEKTGGTNSETVQLLNNENYDYVAVAVIHIGTVGINITNLGVASILPDINNAGSVGISIEQFIARLDRCKFIWRGTFADDLAKIKDRDQRDLMIKLAVNSSSRICFATGSHLTEKAHKEVVKNHVTTEDAEGYLQGLISIFREQSGYSSISGQERELSYKNARKERCEFPDCQCYKELVEDIKELSKPIREIHYQQILQVDHKDGDRENMNPDNLITLCPNRHSFKTMENKDYLNKYYEDKPVIIPLKKLQKV